ncbi:hypothetical protein PSQ19_05980 [Devosia algicola]|uniref:DUF2793 domain-containing protein n=1 Tax=Devosia algicola TaxID=3026418 RepID=A0ABY7YQT1_9HYPH|nr:hypothetical protein [Devosia algicola]WDR03616.1 hypothetical protein PSQ19_05980 [Devosia algicola]
MPRDGSGVASPPAGTTATPNTTILSANYNAWVADVTAIFNTAWPVSLGGTGTTDLAFPDGTIRIKNTADPSKKIAFDASGITTGTTRTITVPDANGTIALTSNIPTVPIVTDWVAYTPAFQGFGTPTGVSMWSRRVGDTLQIRGKFTTGTGTAVEGRIFLGYNGTSSNVASDSTKVVSIQLAGTLVLSIGASVYSFYALIESGTGYLTFGFHDATTSGMTKQTGSQLGTATTVSIMAEVPISGWGS